MKTSLDKFFALALFALCLPFAAQADEEGGMWLGVSVEKKLPKTWWKNADDFSVNIGASYRLGENFKQSTRVDASVGIDYKINKYLKAGVGYVFIHSYTPGEIDLCYDDDDVLKQFPKDDEYNWDNSFWRNRHRALVEVTGKVKFGRFTLSLRERYQYTSFCSANYQRDKYEAYDLNIADGKNIKQTWLKNEKAVPVFKEIETSTPSTDTSLPNDDFFGDDEDFFEGNVQKEMIGHEIVPREGWPRLREKEHKEEHVLRSRLKLEYDIKGCPLAPFVSYEIHNFLDDKMKVDKHRLSAGADWKISKQHKLAFAYLLNAPDFKSGTVRNHVVDLSYKFEF